VQCEHVRETLADSADVTVSRTDMSLKAIRLIAAGIAKARLLELLHSFRLSAEKHAIVIGGDPWHDGLYLVLCADRDCNRCHQLGGFADQSLKLDRNHCTWHAITIVDRHLFKSRITRMMFFTSHA
jgi:hypothetical protein